MSSTSNTTELYRKKGILSFKSSLGRMMVFSLMFFTFVPVTILSIVLYLDGKEGIDEVIHNIVINNAETKSDHISTLFTEAADQINTLAADAKEIPLYIDLAKSAPEEYGRFQEYLGTTKYTTITQLVKNR